MCFASQARLFLPNFWPLFGSVYCWSNVPSFHCCSFTRPLLSSAAPAQSSAVGVAIFLPLASEMPQIVNAVDPDPLGRFCALTSTVWLYFRPVALGRTCIFGPPPAAPSPTPPTAIPIRARPPTMTPACQPRPLRIRSRPLPLPVPVAVSVGADNGGLRAGVQAPSTDVS